MLHILQLVLHRATVTTITRITPDHDKAVANKGSNALQRAVLFNWAYAQCQHIIILDGD